MSAIHSSHYRIVIEMLVQARKSVGLTQTEVSGIWGKTQSTIVAIESGQRRLDVAEFIELCEILNTNPHDIISEAHTVMKKSLYGKLGK